MSNNQNQQTRLTRLASSIQADSPMDPANQVAINVARQHGLSAPVRMTDEGSSTVMEPSPTVPAKATGVEGMSASRLLKGIGPNTTVRLPESVRHAWKIYSRHLEDTGMEPDSMQKRLVLLLWDFLQEQAKIHELDIELKVK